MEQDRLVRESETVEEEGVMIEDKVLAERVQVLRLVVGRVAVSRRTTTEMVTTIKQTKVCNRCGIEKPMEEFYVKSSMCKYCHVQYDEDRYIRKSTKNKKLYGIVYTPMESEERKERWVRRCARNRKLYGTACTSAELKKSRKRDVDGRAERRTRAMTLLGSKCECCGESDPTKLTFDHIHGGGNGVRGDKIVREILTMGSPESKYRILCWNCNGSLGTYGYCPHQYRPPGEAPASSTREPIKYNRQRRKKIRLELFAAYGGKCPICGEDKWEFLTVDHINGGGNQHKRELGIEGRGSNTFYMWLRKQGYPKGGYQLLCLNCNCSKGKRQK